MIKIVLFFTLLPISLFSQTPYEIYELNRNYKENKLYSKLTLSPNGDYFKKDYNTGHQLESYEEKGKWFLEGDTLFLKLERLIVFPEFPESKWKDFYRKDSFLIKRKRITPIYNQKLVRRFSLKAVTNK